MSGHSCSISLLNTKSGKQKGKKGRVFAVFALLALLASLHFSSITRSPK
jgi:hypothetical protein